MYASRSSTWESRSLSLPLCPIPPWQVVIVWFLYVVYYDWYLCLSFLSMVLSSECTQLLLLLWCPVMCRAFYVSSTVESLIRQEQQWPILLPGHLHVRFCKASLGNSLPGWVSDDPFHLGCTIWYCSTVRSLHHGPSVKVQVRWLAGSLSISGAIIRRHLL